MIRPIIFIVGPTASGKTDLALQLAEYHDGAIICADSRTVYRGLDIGTAKPTADERKRVVHYGIDLISPDQPYSAFQFKQMAEAAIDEITSMGKLPIIVGGTGLYIDTLLFDMQLGPEADEGLRADLQVKTVEELQSIITDQGYGMPDNSLNKLHLIRTIEREGRIGEKRARPIEGAQVYGIDVEKSTLEERIRARAEMMFSNPLLYEEAYVAADMYGWNTPGLSGNIYRLLHQLLDETITKNEAIEKFVILDRQLAKRQMTWFRRNHFITWGDKDDLLDVITSEL